MNGDGVDLEVVDPTAPLAPIEDRVREVCGQLNVLHAQLVELAAEVDATGAWHGTGIKSLAQWLTWQCGLAPGRAHEVVRLAEARTTHPATMSVFAEGGLSVDQVAIATKAPAYLDDHFAEVAPLATVAQLRTMMRAARPAPPKPVPEHEETFKAHFDDDGRYRFQGVLDADHGRIVDAALTAARDVLFHDGHTRVSWADAVVEMAQRSMDAATPARRGRFRVTWFLDPANPVPASWIDGIAIPDWLREHLSCDGTISPTFTADARPVNVGRTQRAVPERTRRLVLHRDKKCRVPGCTQTRWLQVHHLDHRGHGGPDDMPNLVALCPADHRLHHQGRLGITGDADDPNGLVFTDAHGEIIDPAARPTAPTRPPPEPKVPYEHPLGDRMQHWSIMYPNPPCDTGDAA